MLLQVGSVLNYESDSSGGFDALSASKKAGIFVLADGANSSPAGGRASRLAVETITHEIRSNPEITPAEAFDIAHSKIKTTTPIATGTTCVSVRVNESLSIHTCGDSLAEVYSCYFIFGWQLVKKSTPDILADGDSPSQLLGSDVYYGPAELRIDIRRKTLVLMMTDGAYKFTSAGERRKLVAKLAREIPSESDLDFLARCLAELAYKNGSRDDISAIFIWLDPNRDEKNIYQNV